ncbi:MAG: hypothetical protein ACM3ZA_15470 [Bacillota bacterium]
MDRLQEHRRQRREKQDRWLGRLAEVLVVASLVYLLARSPLGQSLVDAVEAIRLSF